MQKTTKIKELKTMSEEKTKKAKEPRVKTSLTQAQRLSFLEGEFKKVLELIPALQNEVKELKEDTLTNAQHLYMLKKFTDKSFKDKEEKMNSIKEELLKEFQNLTPHNDEGEKELIYQVLECLITHIEALENKNKGFFSFSKSKLRNELQELKTQKFKTKLNFSLNDD